MFSKRDYLSYFDNIKSTEEEMIRRAKEMSGKFKGEAAQEIIADWLDDEQEHQKIAQAMIDSVK